MTNKELADWITGFVVMVRLGVAFDDAKMAQAITYVAQAADRLREIGTYPAHMEYTPYENAKNNPNWDLLNDDLGRMRDYWAKSNAAPSRPAAVYTINPNLSVTASSTPGNPSGGQQIRS